jgi:hypothetical protein
MILHTCPISFKKIDHNVVRLAGFFSLILIAAAFTKIFGDYSKYLILFLTFDFLARIFNDKFSLLKIISVNILHGLLKIQPEEVGVAPKRFAAGIGATFSFLIFILIFVSESNLNNFDIIIKFSLHFLTMLLVTAISLETFFGFCIGCKIYSYLQ